jgi:hypothetical protein
MIRTLGAVAVLLLAGCASPAERVAQAQQDLVGRSTAQIRACAGPPDFERPDALIYEVRHNDVATGTSYQLGDFSVGTSLGRTVIARECTAMLQVQGDRVVGVRLTGTGAPGEAPPLNLCVQRLRGCL